MTPDAMTELRVMVATLEGKINSCKESNGLKIDNLEKNQDLKINNVAQTVRGLHAKMDALLARPFIKVNGEAVKGLTLSQINFRLILTLFGLMGGAGVAVQLGKLFLIKFFSQ